jgi:methanol--5-hydroxybenzimidazolylcobamide Co-methyltransferase
MGKRSFPRITIDGGNLMYGSAVHPLDRNGVQIGAGEVLPEIKFTLPTMQIGEETMPDVRGQYREMLEGILSRAVELSQERLVVELELLPPLTANPAWGAEITAIVRDVMERYRSGYGQKALLRLTAVDLRESHGSGKRDGRDLQNVLETFRLCARSGADLLAIESIGGKEVTDKAVMEADFPGYVMGLMLACRDMEFLWGRICSVAEETGSIPSGDTACGFGNTAMVLADRRYTPKVFAAVVRAMTAVRSLVAYEQGGVGPGKDCGYENPYLKAITGFPMSMEGKSAACAHFSCLGNISAAYADLWSNESVQNVRLLSGMAPVVSTEQLIYDCRLLNTAAESGETARMRDWLVKSDAPRDVQAFIFTPDNVGVIAMAIVSGGNHYDSLKNTAAATLDLIWKGCKTGGVRLSDLELKWLRLIQESLGTLPPTASDLIASLESSWSETVDFREYGY